MPNHVTHFAIHADDTERARTFYTRVFGWTITPWGPPGFFMIRTGTEADPGIHGSLQQRREPVSGKGVTAYECTIGVDDLDAIETLVTKHGGKIITPQMQIPTVGSLFQLHDTEGNLVVAMRYDAR